MFANMDSFFLFAVWRTSIYGNCTSSVTLHHLICIGENVEDFLIICNNAKELH